MPTLLQGLKLKYAPLQDDFTSGAQNFSREILDSAVQWVKLLESRLGLADGGGPQEPASAYSVGDEHLALAAMTPSPAPSLSPGGSDPLLPLWRYGKDLLRNQAFKKIQSFHPSQACPVCMSRLHPMVEGTCPLAIFDT